MTNELSDILDIENVPNYELTMLNKDEQVDLKSLSLKVEILDGDFKGEVVYVHNFTVNDDDSTISFDYETDINDERKSELEKVLSYVILKMLVGHMDELDLDNSSSSDSQEA